jgi:hypothetical protein
MATQPCVSGASLAEHKASIERKQRQAFRDRWHKHVSGHNAASVAIPDDVERFIFDAPCGFCGTARGLCRHRVAA